MVTANETFADIDTAERQSIPQTIDQLVRCHEFENSLHGFFADITVMPCWNQEMLFIII